MDENDGWEYMHFFVRTLLTLGIQPSTGASCPEGNLSFNSCSQYSVGQGIPNTNPQAKYRLNFQELGSYLQCNAWISIWHPPIRHSSRPAYLSTDVSNVSCLKLSACHQVCIKTLRKKKKKLVQFAMWPWKRTSHWKWRSPVYSISWQYFWPKMAEIIH